MLTIGGYSYVFVFVCKKVQTHVVTSSNAVLLLLSLFLYFLVDKVQVVCALGDALQGYKIIGVL